VVYAEACYGAKGLPGRPHHIHGSFINGIGTAEDGSPRNDLGPSSVRDGHGAKVMAAHAEGEENESDFEGGFDGLDREE